LLIRYSHDVKSYVIDRQIVATHIFLQALSDSSAETLAEESRLHSSQLWQVKKHVNRVRGS
jgi:hypothetical protein